jgi:hypothetical protein
MVWAGYQDYFFDLYDGKLMPRQSLDTVPSVVTAITTALEVITLYPELVKELNLIGQFDISQNM